MDLVTVDPDFVSPQDFWQNVYKLWLASYAKMADPDFHTKMKVLVTDFNEMYLKEGFEAEYERQSPMTFSELKHRETAFGEPGYATYEQRTVASKILNII